MRYLALTLLLMLPVGCGTIEDESGQLAGAREDESTGRNKTIPYSVMKRDEFLDAKVSFDIRVDLIDGRLPSEEELAIISRELKRKEKPHDRTFVVFYLPGMQVDAGGFATAHHTPNLEVRILPFNLPDKYAHLVKKAHVEAKEPRNAPGATETQIVCDEFELLTNVTGSTLDLSINTDLPDNTVVMVSVKRCYLEKGNSATYSLDYFSEKSIIGKWKSKQRISIASEKWKSALSAKQEEMSRLGLGFDVASISDRITVRMVVPINQADPRFGDRNANLAGKAVRTTGMRVVEDEIEIDYPLDSPPLGKSSFPSLHPLKLDVGQTYVVSRQTPLMPTDSASRGFEEVMSAIQEMKQIPNAGRFKVVEMARKQNTNPWYRVIAFDQDGRQIGTGWINSTALFGQELKAHK